MATPPGFSQPPTAGRQAKASTTAKRSTRETTGPSEGPATMEADELLADGHGGGPSPDERSTRPTSSSPASTDVEQLAAAEGYRDFLASMAGQAVGMASLLVRWARSRRRPLPPGVWVADEADRAAIGEPLARIAARHAPVGGQGSDDVVDGLAVVVATTGYAMKGLDAEAAVGEVDELLQEHLDHLDEHGPPAPGPAPAPNGAAR